MLYLTGDTYIGRSLDLYGQFSQAECNLFAMLIRPGDVVVEAGSNVGAHTVMLAQQVGPQGRIFAFEPQRILFQILCANLALNSIGNVVAQPHAVGRAQGSLLIPAIDYSQPNNFGGLSLGTWQQGEPVTLQTIDQLNLPVCRMIKADVEGMETDVVAGAVETIQRCRPILYLENDRQDKSPALIQQLFDLGYRVYWHFPPLFSPNPNQPQQENVFGNIISVNVLAIHASFEQAIDGLREIQDPQDKPLAGR